MIAASLKPDGHRTVHHVRVHFRDQMIAASLKLERAARMMSNRQHFRDQMIAASLKRPLGDVAAVDRRISAIR